jgi:hypothetical protein
VNTTTRRATRRISRSPAIGSCQHHRVSAVALFQQQAAQSAQVHDRVGVRLVNQVRDLTQAEAQPPVDEYLS